MMKFIYSIIILAIFLCPVILAAQNTPPKKDYILNEKNIKVILEKEYTYKAVEYCNKKYNYGKDTVSYFIGIKIRPIPSDTLQAFEPLHINCSYFWNKIFNRYSNDEKIKILEELLEYENDKNLSGKKVGKYGFVEENTPNPQTISYTMQTEALYIITLLTMKASSLSYCPYPVLINTKTNKEINNNQKEIKKVYKIYRKWIHENAQNGFVDYAPPLKRTNYKWYGGTDYPSDYRTDNLKQPNMIIGERKNR